MKTFALTTAFLILGLNMGCGNSHEPEGFDCVEQCAMTFSKEHTICNGKYGRTSEEGLECSSIALKTNDQCAAKCYE